MICLILCYELISDIVGGNGIAGTFLIILPLILILINLRYYNEFVNNRICHDMSLKIVCETYVHMRVIVLMTIFFLKNRKAVR